MMTTLWLYLVSHIFLMWHMLRVVEVHRSISNTTHHSVSSYTQLAVLLELIVPLVPHSY